VITTTFDIVQRTTGMCTGTVASLFVVLLLEW